MSNYSLLQETLLRPRDQSDLFMDPIITTNINFHQIIDQQLANIGSSHEMIILEPQCKDTGPAITTALLMALKKHGPQQIISIFPADHYFLNFSNVAHIMRSIVRDLYSCVFKDGSSGCLDDSIITFGVKPNEPDNEQYGYVHKGDPVHHAISNNDNRDGASKASISDHVFHARHFLEKPKKHTAKKLTKSGKFLWNMGIYMGSVECFLRKIRLYSYDTYAICDQAIK